MSLLLPQRLSHQIALTVSVLFALTVLLYTVYTVLEQSEMGEQTIARQGEALARGVGAMATGSMLGDAGQLTDILMQVANDPEIRSLHVLAPDGRVIAGGHKKSSYALAGDGVPHPEFKLPPTRKFQEAAVNGLAIWQEISGQSGWVRLEVGFESLDKIRSHIWQDSLVAAVLAIVMAVAVLLYGLARPMRVLTQAAEFAAGLDIRRGEFVPDYRGCQEISGLVAALNRVRYVSNCRKSGSASRTVFSKA